MIAPTEERLWSPCIEGLWDRSVHQYDIHFLLAFNLFFCPLADVHVRSDADLPSVSISMSKPWELVTNQ
jgi:hypothetical protein